MPSVPGGFQLHRHCYVPRRRDIKSYARHGRSGIGRRTTSSKVPAPSAAIAAQLAELPAEGVDAAATLDTFAQLGFHLQAACSKYVFLR